jgi:hypothetical protein
VWLDERRAFPPLSELVAGAPVRLLALLAVGCAVAAALVMLDVLPRGTLRIVAVAGGHGALLVTALRWATLKEGPEPLPDSQLVVVVMLLAIGAAAALLGPWGALAQLAVPIWIARHARAGRLRRLGLMGDGRVVPLGVGLAIGLALGGHLLLSAAQTFGHRLRADGVTAYLEALAYDVGANVPSSELFFRGALFNRAQRLTAFAPAATLTTMASLLRYVVDPLLPKTPEVVLGMLFYVTLLGVANAWLRWWSGSLLPCLLSALAFFAVYRLLAMA